MILIGRLIMVKEEHKTIAQLEEARRKHYQGKVAPGWKYRGIECGFLHNPGVILNTPVGRAIMPNLMHPFVYRGQNQEYDYFIPSIYRKPIHPDGFTDELRLFYRELQLVEFCLFINSFPRVKKWREYGFYVWEECIAQHYGLYTSLLDITNNFDVALFFACCKYDHINNSYRPLSTMDIKGNQYGVIYGKFFDLIPPLEQIPYKPLGFQPFMRPNNQRGFTVCLYNNKQATEESLSFDWKIKFKHDIGYSKKVFDEFDGGEKIFVKKDVNKIENIINQIKDASEYSQAAFDEVYTQHSWNKSKEYYELELNKAGIEIGYKPYKITEEDINSLDANWDFGSFLRECGVDQLYEIKQEKEKIIILNYDF
jgi:hypothetical protein